MVPRQKMRLVSALVMGLVLLGVMLVPAAPVQAEDVTVTIGDNFFEPATVTVNVGDTVTWRHTGNRPHDVTFSGGMFESPRQMRNGQQVSYTATTPGTYEYVCTIHEGGGMRATLIVRAAGATTDTTTTGTTQTPSMPRTGAGGGAGEPTGLIAGLGGLLLLAVGGLAYLGRRRSA